MISLTDPIALQNTNPIQPVPMEATTTTTATKPTLAEQVSTWLNIGKEAADIYSTVKNPQTGTQQTPMPYTPPPPAPTNTMKYVLISGALLAAGIGIYAVTTSKKK